MEIKFYTCNDVSNKLNKKLLNEYNTQCTLKNNCDIIKLKIMLEVDDIEVFLLQKYNYCYIPILERYYFITNINIYRNNLLMIDIEIDILMSYKNELNNRVFHIIKSENTENIISADVKENYSLKSDSYDVDFINQNGNNILITQIL